MDEARVHISGFRMDFGDTTVIRGLSFDVRAGETFGFLGSNGSGKTTTIRALLGIYQPTAGTLHITAGLQTRGRGPARLPPGGARAVQEGKRPRRHDLLRPAQRAGTATARHWSLEYLERVALADKATAGWTSSPAASSRRSSSA